MEGERAVLILGPSTLHFKKEQLPFHTANAAKQAKKHGDTNLAKICGIISSDEKRHEEAYTKITNKLFDVDPDTTMLALAYLMRKHITMPGSLMLMSPLITRWNVGKVTAGTFWEGRKAQDYVCNLPPKFRNWQRELREEPRRFHQSPSVGSSTD
ncbi:stearoyl-acyl-carrier-protein 9-desaturase, chloroplastic-like protein [Cinnamomum micranthum f. kanehirae]|uniref:Stearoyl-acyl-carrier-protein 9-desaturase, chloroplastic-like protein n=1 Tax=Cinnamomum micranthum f. kanehirae TaxID=337451 RepID=A0A3S3NIL3_9MAGN|nr:stearoyl-acyl-carrier-protein 9-desaturase, chloroplastic-like protein [Cinnamomum micranthum f. kanehirae]